MACKTSCKLCKHLVISTAVTFTNGQLVIIIPPGSYMNGEKYCIVVAQTIPAEATVNANVVINISGTQAAYPLMRCDCRQATACNINTRTRYSTRVQTTASGGVFRLLGPIGCCNNELPFINGT